MAVLIKKDKKTGKTYRINTPDWDWPMPVLNGIAPAGMGVDLSISSHPAFAILTSSAANAYSWSFSFFNPVNWLLQTSTNSGSTWITNSTVAGSLYSTGSVISAGTWVSVIGVDANGTASVGRSNIIYL